VSDANIVIGYISEALPTYQPDRLFFRRANDAILTGLPLEDAWPPLCRSMFSVTGDDWHQGSFRGRRLIHFAGNINYLLGELGKWLDKFEDLLARMYWLDAEVLSMRGWSGPPLVLRYRVSPEAVRGYMSPAPQPPSAWELRASRIVADEPVGVELADVVGQDRVLKMIPH
jgi:hypothetical protein